MEDDPSAWAPTMHMGDPGVVPGSRIWPGPIGLPLQQFERVNQRTEALFISVSFSNFVINRSKKLSELEWHTSNRRKMLQISYRCK